MTRPAFVFALAMLSVAAVLLPSQGQAQQGDAAQPNALGMSVRHIHIRVMDVERTKAFYRDKLGFPVTNSTPTVVEFPGLWFGKWTGPGAIPTGGITIGIAAKSVEAVYNELKRRGVDLPNPPAPVRGEYSFTFKDPDGYVVEVEGPK
ncbi:MAG TPA: VOC family protein [Terriglobia bacterium]|nr:VOC family protein [Terriglobia bacterium]